MKLKINVPLPEFISHILFPILFRLWIVSYKTKTWQPLYWASLLPCWASNDCPFEKQSIWDLCGHHKVIFREPLLAGDLAQGHKHKHLPCKCAVMSQLISGTKKTLSPKVIEYEWKSDWGTRRKYDKVQQVKAGASFEYITTPFCRIQQ